MCGSVVTLCVMFVVMEISAVEVPKLKLNNGREIPSIALGTYLGFDQIFNQSGYALVKPENTKQCNLILKAIDAGYRHFDTAAIYETEQLIGNAVRRKIEAGVVMREDIFITTKLWNTQHRREQVVPALRDSLAKLNLNYVDLYLMHWPMALNENYSLSDVDYMETWRGLEDTATLGLAKSIGVSNFNLEQLKRVLAEGTIKPAVLQIEVHIQNAQAELVSYAQSQNLVVMGYSPMGSLVARQGVSAGPGMDHPVLVAIAARHNKTVPQVVLRWLIDRHIIPTPKTVRVSRLKENIDVFDFSLTSEEIEQINKFDSHTRYTCPSFWQNHPYYPFEKVDNPIEDPFKDRL